MNLKRTLVVLLPMCLVACDAGTATPKEGTAPGVVAMGISASAFVQGAAHAGNFEIEASRLAQSQARTPEVKAFADMMIENHTRIAADLRYAAGNHPLPEELGQREKALLADLSIRNGVEFDRLYIAEVAVAGHEDAIRLFEQFGRQGPDGQLKQFALVTLPRLKGHLEQGRLLRVSKSAAVRETILRRAHV